MARRCLCVDRGYDACKVAWYGLPGGDGEVVNIWCRGTGVSVLALGLLAASCGGTPQAGQGGSPDAGAAVPFEGDSGGGAADAVVLDGEAPGPADVTPGSDAADAVGQAPPAPTVLCARAFAVTQPGGSVAIAEDATGAVTIAGTMSGTADFGTGTLHAELPGDLPGSGVFVAGYDAQCNPLYSREFGSNAALWSMAGDSDGKAVLVGAFDEPVDFGTGPLGTQGHGMFLVQLGPKGNMRWVRSWESDRRDAKVAIGSGGAIWIVGPFHGTVDILGHTLVASGSDGMYVLRLTAEGHVVWARSLGGTGIGTVGAVLPLPSGGVAITGSVYAPVDIGVSVLDPGESISAAFLVELDRAGCPIAARAFPSRSDTYGRALAAGPDGSIVLRTSTNLGTNFGNGMLVPPLDTPALDDWSTLAKFDSSRNLIWSGLYARRDFGWDHSVAVDAEGNVLMAGRFLGTVDFGAGALVAPDSMRAYVAKLGPDGDGIWSLGIGEGPSPQGPAAIVVNEHGDSALLGAYLDNAAPLVTEVPGPAGFFIARFAP